MMLTVAQALAQSGLVPVDAQVLLAYVVGNTRAWLTAHADESLTPNEAARFFMTVWSYRPSVQRSTSSSAIRRTSPPAIGISARATCGSSRWHRSPRAATACPRYRQSLAARRSGLCPAVG